MASYNTRTGFNIRWIWLKRHSGFALPSGTDFSQQDDFLVLNEHNSSTTARNGLRIQHVALEHLIYTQQTCAIRCLSPLMLSSCSESFPSA